MEKNLEYYMALPYKIELERDADTNGYTASIPQLAKREWITTALNRGIAIQEPDDELKSYSGQLRLRIPRSLHRDISMKAREEGVSMNQYCVSLLSAGYGVHYSH